MIFSHTGVSLGATASISKLLYTWMFIGTSEHHYTTQTSKFKKKLNWASFECETMSLDRKL